MIDVVIVTDFTSDIQTQDIDIPDDDFAKIQVIYEESLLVFCLENLGLTVVRAAWDGPFQWDTARCAIIRSTCNNINDVEGFRKWLKDTDKKTKLINSLEICDWSTDKKYLTDLENTNIPIVKSMRLSYSDIDNLESFFDRLQTQTIIVKPFISICDLKIFKIRLDEVVLYRTIIKDLLSKQDLLVQPFMESIVTKGERLFIVINGKLCHSALKIAKAGQFRVLERYEWYVLPYAPSDSERQFAENVVRNCTKKPLYARVDVMLNSDNQMLVKDLKLLKPNLFLQFDRRSADCFAQAIQNILNST